MAGKLKGQGGIKGLLLLHGEKVAIGLVALAALWLVYKTTSLPHLEDKYQPDKLRQEISDTSAAVQQATWPAENDPLFENVSPYKPIGEKAEVAIGIDQYVNKDAQGKVVPLTGIAPVAPSVLRSDPVLLNADDARARGGSGLLAFIDEEVKKRRDLERAEEEAKRAQREAEQAEREKNNPQQPGGGLEGGRNRGGRRAGDRGFGEGVDQPFDPDHPKRKPLGGMGQAVGVPLQGGERIEQAYWAIVTAKVPIHEQLKLFQDAFENAKSGFDPMRDFPQYKGYFVQRAEVVPGKDLDWKPVPVYAGEHKFITAGQAISRDGVALSVIMKVYEIAAQTWAGQLPDVIDGRFADYILTFPLPPLVGRDWGAEATHPDIPLIADTPPLEEEFSPLSPQAPQDERTIDSPFAATDPTQAMPGYPPAGPGGAMGRGAFGGNRFGGPGGMGRGFGGEGGFRPSPGEFGMGRGFGGEGGARGGYAGGGMPAAGTARSSLPKGVDYLLLRFFDFTVEPGKRYKYRVQLVLADPNFAMPRDTLAPEVLDRHAKEAQTARANKTARVDIRRVEGWSDASPTAGIPLAGSVKLVDIKPASSEKINDEPVAKLLVESVDYDVKRNATQAAIKKDLRRGNVANMVEDAWYVGEGWIDEWPDFHFVTGMTVLDMDGGKKLSRDYTSPGRVLIMGPAGELYIRNELDDKMAVDQHDLVFDEDKRNKMLGFGEGEAGFGPAGGGRNFRGGRGGRGEN